MASTSEKRIALIGCGAMGLEHIRNLKLINGVSIVAVADSNEQARSEAREILNEETTIVSDYNELKCLEIDVIIVATPNYSHIEVLRTIIPWKKHLLVEKPLCTTIPDCHEVKDLLAKTEGHGLFWVGMEYRFMPPISQLLEVVDSGDLGKIHMVHIREHRFPFLLKVANWNRFSKYTGGTLVEKCCHFWDLMRRIVGPDNEAVRVFASGGMDVNHKDEKYHLEDGKAPEVPDIVDNAFVIVEFSGGVRCCLDLCMFAEDRQHEEVSVVGSSGKVHAEAPACVVTHHTPSQRASGQGATKTRKPPMPGTYEKHTKMTEAHVDPVLLEAGYHEGATYYELEAFLKAVNDKTAPVVTVDDGFASVAIGIAAEVSIKEQRVVNMAEINAMIAQPDTGGAASQDEEPSKRQKKE